MKNNCVSSLLSATYSFLSLFHLWVVWLSELYIFWVIFWRDLKKEILFLAQSMRVEERDSPYRFERWNRRLLTSNVNCPKLHIYIEMYTLSVIFQVLYIPRYVFWAIYPKLHISELHIFPGGKLHQWIARLSELTNIAPHPPFSSLGDFLHNHW